MNTVFFDLDGTMLPLDQELFVKAYIKTIAGKFSLPPYNLNRERFVNALLSGTEAMSENDGSITNEKRFWQVFSKELGMNVKEIYSKDFDDFYANEFLTLEKITKKTKYTKLVLDVLKSKGYNLVAATNPLFPPTATKARLNWAGADYDDFILVTAYDNCSFCKPNIKYYEEVLSIINKKPQECLMVGNDVDEDMCVKDLGFSEYLITDCLINRNKKDILKYRNGTYYDFYNFVQQLPSVQ